MSMVIRAKGESASDRPFWMTASISSSVELDAERAAGAELLDLGLRRSQCRWVGGIGRSVGKGERAPHGDGLNRQPPRGGDHEDEEKSCQPSRDTARRPDCGVESEHEEHRGDADRDGGRAGAQHDNEGCQQRTDDSEKDGRGASPGVGLDAAVDDG